MHLLKVTLVLFNNVVIFSFLFYLCVFLSGRVTSRVFGTDRWMDVLIQRVGWWLWVTRVWIWTMTVDPGSLSLLGSDHMFGSDHTHFFTNPVLIRCWPDPGSRTHRGLGLLPIQNWTMKALLSRILDASFRDHGWIKELLSQTRLH